MQLQNIGIQVWIKTNFKVVYQIMRFSHTITIWAYSRWNDIVICHNRSIFYHHPFSHYEHILCILWWQSMHIVTVFNAAVCLSHTECCHPFTLSTTKITNLHQLLILNQEKVVKECKICSWAVPVGGFVLSSSFGNFPKVFGTNWSLFLTPMWVQPHH